MAHDHPNQLQRLLALVDDVRNDIYLHIDARTDIEPFLSLTTDRSRLHILPNRVKVYWGHISMVEATLTLFQAAIDGGQYGHIHLLSGQDMPLRSQDDIHLFFDDEHPDEEFVEVSTDLSDIADAVERTSHRYLLTRWMQPGQSIAQRLMHRAFRTINALQRTIGRRRAPIEGLAKGANWMSITPECARYLVEHSAEIMSMFDHTLNPDEMFAQTILVRDPRWAERLSPLGSARAIDWERGAPYVWTKTDVAALMDGPCMFARKFSLAEHPKAIELIEQRIQDRKGC